MKRDEFPGKIKDQAAQRADGHCERCGMPFNGRRPEFHHILDAAYGGKGTLTNCLCICVPCHKVLTAEQAPKRAKADRQRRAANGASRSKQKIAHRPKPEKPPPKSKAPQRRDVYGRDL